MFWASSPAQATCCRNHPVWRAGQRNGEFIKIHNIDDLSLWSCIPRLWYLRQIAPFLAVKTLKCWLEAGLVQLVKQDLRKTEQQATSSLTQSGDRGPCISHMPETGATSLKRWQTHKHCTCSAGLISVVCCRPQTPWIPFCKSSSNFNEVWRTIAWQLDFGMMLPTPGQALHCMARKRLAGMRCKLHMCSSNIRL